jgi:hypothetical protein
MVTVEVINYEIRQIKNKTYETNSSLRHDKTILLMQKSGYKILPEKDIKI